jgi:hypothetical protein
MKTIVETSTNISKYLFEDSVSVVMSTDQIIVGDPPQFIIDDMNNNNSTLYTDITDHPDDWTGCKYTFNGTTWISELDSAD